MRYMRRMYYIRCVRCTRHTRHIRPAPVGGCPQAPRGPSPPPTALAPPPSHRCRRAAPPGRRPPLRHHERRRGSRRLACESARGAATSTRPACSSGGLWPTAGRLSSGSLGGGVPVATAPSGVSGTTTVSSPWCHGQATTRGAVRHATPVRIGGFESAASNRRWTHGCRPRRSS